ncbi:hypothetical protein HMPREF9004_1536 [Schaalia cardiffensis F0333]|uniref:Uncharacterized protein n=1 Tax=Schaalia cardiffensis F0333 TaxID=888050 RepID=N6X1H7_9ACTO|nr:hypothetical protein HMPREF9004_1536 [Schaalia cardiffensis F0333]
MSARYRIFTGHTSLFAGLRRRVYSHDPRGRSGWYLKALEGEE